MQKTHRRVCASWNVWAAICFRPGYHYPPPPRNNPPSPLSHIFAHKKGNAFSVLSYDSMNFSHSTRVLPKGASFSGHALKERKSNAAIVKAFGKNVYNFKTKTNPMKSEYFFLSVTMSWPNSMTNVCNSAGARLQRTKREIACYMRSQKTLQPKSRAGTKRGLPVGHPKGGKGGRGLGFGVMIVSRADK